MPYLKKSKPIPLFLAVFGAAAVFFLLASRAFTENPQPKLQMTEAAKNLIATFSDEQRGKAFFPFDSEERMNWHYIPKPRKGISFKDLDRAQSFLVHGLLNSALSQKGYMKATEIMSLEPVLRELESKTGDARPNLVRDADLYFLSIFGEPSADKPWGWRLEGHHISLNFTIQGDQFLASSPAFFGANPHEVMEGPRKGFRPLAAEEDLGRALLKSLDESQMKQAVIDPTAPPDIFTKNSRKAEFEGPPKGIPRSAMNDEQKKMLGSLINEYIENLHPALADKRRAKLDQLTPDQMNQIWFAWMGGTEKGQPNYYRVQAPTFLIEYDNTQNNANHSHTVWRDFNGDFGLDFLALHHESEH